MKEWKVLIVHNRLMPYKVPVFSSLGRAVPLRIVVTRELERPWKHPDFETYFVQKELSLLGTVKSVLRLARTLLNDNYHVVIGGNWDDAVQLTEGIISLLIARLRQKGFVLWTESWNYDATTISKKRKIADPVIRMLVSNSDAIIVPGTKSQQLMLHLGANPDKITLAPNWSEVVGCQDYSQTSREIDGGPTRTRFLYLSRIVPYKGLDVLLQSIEILQREGHSVSIAVGGTGPDERTMRDLATQLRLSNVCFLGHIPQESMAKTFRESDVFVLPSRFYQGTCEAWGLVLNEAMGCGLPVITTTAVGGAYDLIKNGDTGFVVEENNPSKLADAMRRFCENRDLARQMGKRARKRILEGFTRARMIEGLVSGVEIAASKRTDWKQSGS